MQAASDHVSGSDGHADNSGQQHDGVAGSDHGSQDDMFNLSFLPSQSHGQSWTEVSDGADAHNQNTGTSNSWTEVADNHAHQDSDASHSQSQGVDSDKHDAPINFSLPDSSHGSSDDHGGGGGSSGHGGH